ncbi:amylo-alpha-1,6-glucosidase [Aetokthonos hydrillicola Thurmond2011]|jgi:4-alpha-glucanotransferase|uniref:Amylo-alpha-1,6-glucosidase n=1 Tax=Aetokthonos hydrillicola Thurmond2011 TaxID=2712845 RepID=A0AAP5IDC8_9CYAN|nr:amylo-alpha-1,6-glucosidase [Aetokthonos hydrillicola]MBO3459742.1 amylo-alpha-1,6-glucosidase [Aetokthonos hydrillicola CCALA 1050]MBW4585174.1 amylo-alpha-1,6-glucosidase [Aetokthonos hydrillicola CCALA 1050]MDR9899513.1 amylo-alpha-1,6-glucosidase [Aetokthonos hydrillicola Thurmond2011]
MAELDTREWLLTNGLGSFASGTVCDVRTRTYHGWLFAAKNPPTDRTLLLSHLEASLELPGRVVPLGTNFWGNGQIDPSGYKLLRSFDINPVPKWIWGQDNWQLTRLLVMPYGRLDEGSMGTQREETFCAIPYLSHRFFVQYRYEGRDTAILRLRLFIADRDFHASQKASSELQFSQMLGYQQVCLQGIISDRFGTPWHLRWTQGDYKPEAFWYWNYILPEEKLRGLGDREDLYSPGYLTVTLQPGDAVTLEARTGFPNERESPLTSQTFAEVVAYEQDRLSQIFGGWEKGTMEATKEGEKLIVCPSTQQIPQSPTWQKLLKAADQFIVYRASIGGPTVIAGYHWFNDRGRDTLISLPGLTLVPQRFNLAKGLLQTFGRYCRHGLIPNTFPDIDGEPSYNSIDAALWWIETLGLYLEATQDWQFLAEQYSVIQQIYKAFVGGTRYNIQVDSTDGLVGWDAPGVALTWMDAVIDGQPVTPRRGKPVEVNALWYSALCWASRWAEILSEQGTVVDSPRLAKQAQRYAQQAQQVKTSLQKYWNPQLGYLYDVIEPDDYRNSQIRANAVLALSLAHCGFSYQQGRQILELAKSCLLTPYGLRTLDPSDKEYIGKYTGDHEQRDRAYHQGTVWTWLIGSFIRAWERFYPEKPVPFDWEPLLTHFLSNACIGSVSEIFDGNKPHLPKGVIAQAWSVAEIIRHYRE